MARNDAEQMDQPLCGLADVCADDVTTSVGVENGEVDIGIGIGGVEEAAEADGVGSFPDLENAVDVVEVVQEAAVLVPALPGADGAQDGKQRRQAGVDGFQVAAEEGAGAVQKGLERRWQWHGSNFLLMKFGLILNLNLWFELELVVGFMSK